MANLNDDAWQEEALISFAAQSGTDIPFQGLTQSIDPDLGEKDIEGIPLVNGGRVTAFTPEGDSTVTLEAWPIEAGNEDISAATVGKGFHDLVQAEDTAQPLAITSTTSRSKYRLAILWTDDTSATNASSALSAAAKKGYRLVFANGFVTKATPSFIDGRLKFTITYKVAPFDKSGNAQVMIESTDGTATLTALQSYTSTIKW